MPDDRASQVQFAVVSPGGIRFQFTVDNDATADEMDTLVANARYLATQLHAMGFHPPGADTTATPPETPVQPGWCALHQVQMKYREKDGHGWWSHKVGDEWCRGQ